MKVKHLATATGSANSWSSDCLAEHHKHSRIAKAMTEHPQIIRFVSATEVPPLTEKGDGAEYPSREYYALRSEWITTEELELLKACGVSPDVSRVELHDASWTAAIENKWVRASFVMWNIVLGTVALSLGGVL